jgi:2-polyprenyl-3-methyl-5-hydroxy-6-metoxy-1,4-benzoquinol methylase
MRNGSNHEQRDGKETTHVITADTAAIERRDALVERVFNATVETMDLISIYLGDRMGYYAALDELGDATPAELAAHIGANERYTREWLEQQAVTGILTATDSGDAATRRYALPAGHDEALLNRDSLAYITPFPRMMAGVYPILPALLEAYKHGGGVPYADFGADIREGIADGNRPMFLNLLASEWIPAMPDIHSRLMDTANPARVADVGCGSGWSSISLAKGFPAIKVDGLDVDAASIADATANAAMEGLADRVTFHHADAGNPDVTSHYDLACAFECVHDMADPVAALKAMRDLVGPGGTVFIADEHVADMFTAPGDTIERLMYGFSVLHCLTVGMAEEGSSAETGTVIRSDTMREYAKKAGFRSVEILPIQNDLWRFYRLTA